jgi:transcriptional regulator NrdR family protein
MICAKCGCEEFKVVSVVKRSPYGDSREIECVFCKQKYTTITKINSAIVYDKNTMTSKNLTLDEYTKHIEQEIDEWEKLKQLRVKLFE